MENINTLPVRSGGGIAVTFSAEAMQALRSKQEHDAIERAGRSVPHKQLVSFMPGAEFYQLDSSFALVTYMILGNSVYCYCQFTFTWQPMPNARASDVRQAKNLIKRIA